MSATVTLTGSVGPGVALAAAVYPNVLFFMVDTTLNTVTLVFAQNVTQVVSVAAATVVTSTKTGNTWTLVIS